MKKVIMFSLLLGVMGNVFAAPTLIEASATGTTVKFATKLSEKLPTGYKVKIDLNNGKGLVAMTCSGLTCSLSSNALPKLDSLTYKIGIYDAKGVLQGETTNGSYVIVSKAEINTIPISTTGYTKISNSGAVLPDTATLGSGANDWACTKDNKTGLTWEVKTDDGGLRDKDWYYSWYKPSGDNGGFAGYTDTINGALNCSTQNNCNTDAFTNAVNAKGLCGKKDWRMPTKDELEGLLTTTSTINQPINDNLFIDANYFPNTNSRYWSSSPYADFSGSAWVVLFSNGLSRSNFKIYGYFVRLVRSESININEGAVTFILSINENGEVIDANIKNTEPDNVFDEDFLAEIKEIVMEMKFTPKIVNDKAVRFKGTKTFKFINGDKLKK